MRVKISRPGEQAISIEIIANEEDKECFFDEMVKSIDGVPLEGKLVGITTNSNGIRGVKFLFSAKTA
ncbi:MAG: hypothetical protein AAB598_00015 [Patescibacteria group bacterium]